MKMPKWLNDELSGSLWAAIIVFDRRLGRLLQFSQGLSVNFVGARFG